MTKKLLALLVFIALAGVGCGPYPEKKSPLPLDGTGKTATEYQSKLDLESAIAIMTQQAIDERDPNICMRLPLEGVVWEWQDDYYGYISRRMRSECLDRAMYLIPSGAVCTLISEIPDNDRYIFTKKEVLFDRCFTYAAHAENNSTLCEKVKGTDARAQCLALATKDATHCLSIANLRSDQKVKEIVASTESAIAYIRDDSYSAASCIQAVVFRSHNYQTCELINGVRFGENWTHYRNHCVDIAGYQLQTEGKSNDICDAFVEDHSITGALSWGAKINCQNHGANIDANDFWQEEKQNVLHIAPGLKS